MKKNKKYSFLKNSILFIISIGLIIVSFFIIWMSTLRLPDFNSLKNYKIKSSTKIYDRTGKILLYDIGKNIKRTVIPYEQMGVKILNSTVAIEDSEFYKHKGIRISSIIRATIWAKLTGKKVQGGSTITQQLIKNTLLTNERSITRKIKEWILSVKVEKVISKDDIIALYLNEAPYGGNIYGIEEASKLFFGKEPTSLSLAESAYLAAIPNAPTYYSPYGKHKDKLEERKNLVLKRLLELNFINSNDYKKAKDEKVLFLEKQPVNIAAPHFVFFVKNYLEKKYGINAVENGGLNIITTIDYDLQKKVEKIVLSKALENEEKYSGSNTAVVIIDPKTGQILSMVGSRNYFDKKIDGNFNVATALRQPGSSFKPIVYSQAFTDGYTDKTTLFDVPTEFNTSCDPEGNPLPGSPNANCYMPTNFNSKIRGPMTLRNALAQSINIIAVKLLYLVGVKNSIKMAHNLGITSLNDPTRYGLSLVIGGGEISLLDMTSVYSVFANNGIRNPYQSILSVTDNNNKILEKYKNKSYRVLNTDVTKTLSSILSDNKARTPTYGANSILKIPGYSIAVKTGTTNENRDAWTIGYTPSVVVGVWVGNNDNKPMKKGGSAMAGPIWNTSMKEALKKYPGLSFEKPDSINTTIPPILRGYWQGGETFKIDKTSGGLATLYTPDNSIEEISITNVHNILYWINKSNIMEIKTPKIKDVQYNNWEYGVSKWWEKNNNKYKIITGLNIPTFSDNIHTKVNKPVFNILGLKNSPYNKNELVNITINSKSVNLIKKIDVFINNKYITSLRSYPFKTSFIPIKIGNIQTDNTIHIIGYDVLDNYGEVNLNFSIFK